MLKLLARTLNATVTNNVRICCAGKLHHIPNVRYVQTTDLEFDDEEIVVTDPSKLQLFMKDAEPLRAKYLTQKFKSIFGCTHEKAIEILQSHKNMRHLSLNALSEKVDYLFEEEVSINSILDCPWILSINLRSLQNKFEILKRMKPRNINDYIPLIIMSNPQLLKVQGCFRRENFIFKDSNRLYYFSDQLLLEPNIVSKHFSSRRFMFEISHDMLIENIKTFKEFNVAGINILRDLWAFKYTPHSIRKRLERAKLGHKTKIMPWMVRCPELVLQKSIKITTETRALLKDNETVIDYLSERLGYNVVITRSIASKHPAVFKIRVTKVKEILDYLLDEEGFETYEIAKVPRVLSHSLETTRLRIDELKKLGCRPSSLVIICKSQREYEKFVNKWKDNHTFPK